MILRALIVVLLVFNLGVAAWWVAGGNVVREPTPRPLPGDAPPLRLLGEAEQPVAATATIATAETGAQGSVAAAAATVEPPKPAEQASCLRFGPFADAAARDAARPGIAARAALLRPRDTPARSSRGWKVHIPPYPSREEAQAMGERIKAAGVSDWYLLNQGADTNGIALGRYGSEDAARRREAELKARGIPAQAAALGDSAAQWWLDVRLKPGVAAGSLAGVAPSRRIDCATLR